MLREIDRKRSSLWYVDNIYMLYVQEISSVFRMCFLFVFLFFGFCLVFSYLFTMKQWYE